MPPTPSVPLRQRSARAEWKEILVAALIVTFISVTAAVLTYEKDWVFRFKKIEFEAITLIVVCIALGITWSIRALLGIHRCNDEIPMPDAEYYRLRKINEGLEWMVRYSIASFIFSIAIGLKATSGAPDNLGISIVTLWIPIILYIFSAIWAWELTVVGILLTIAALIIWGIVLLPVSLAIIVGAVIIAYAIYRRKK